VEITPEVEAAAVKYFVEQLARPMRMWPPGGESYDEAPFIPDRVVLTDGRYAGERFLSAERDVLEAGGRICVHRRFVVLDHWLRVMRSRGVSLGGS